MESITQPNPAVQKWRFVFEVNTEYEIRGKPTYYTGYSFSECYNKFMEELYMFEDKLTEIKRVC